MRLDMVLYSTEESDSIAADVNEQTLLKKNKNLKLQFVGETSQRAGWGPTGRKTDKQIRKPKKTPTQRECTQCVWCVQALKRNHSFLTILCNHISSSNISSFLWVSNLLHHGSVVSLSLDVVIRCLGIGCGGASYICNLQKNNRMICSLVWPTPRREYFQPRGWLSF